MYERVNDMLMRLKLSRAKLMHSMAWLVNDKNMTYHGEEASQAALWTEPMRLGLIAPFAVGTVDQVMMAALRIKYGVLRLAGLTDKILIIDELHSYDAYMSEIIGTLLNWCRALQIPSCYVIMQHCRLRKKQIMPKFMIHKRHSWIINLILALLLFMRMRKHSNSQ